MRIESIEGKNIKQLPLFLPPPICYALFAAVKMCVIALHPSAFNWLHNNFIQLTFYEEFLSKPDFQNHFAGIWPVDSLRLDQRGANLLLNEYVVDNNVFDLTPDTLVEHMIAWLNKDMYIYADVNVTKLSTTKNYGIEPPYAHSALIFGYDLSKKIFKMIDFLANGRLDIVDIPFADFADAYFCPHLEEIFKTKRHMNRKYFMTLYKLRSDFVFDLNPNIIKYWLNEFMSCSPTNEKYAFIIYCEKMLGGFSVYEAMIELSKKLFNERGIFEYRMFHAIYDHKKLMLSRVEALQYKQFLDPKLSLTGAAQELIDITDRMRLKVIKNRIKVTSGIIESLDKDMNELIEKEKRFMDTLYSNI